jgi:hypothetical protein
MRKQITVTNSACRNEAQPLCIIVVVILDRWREVTCDRILLLSLRVHAAGAIT